MTQVFRIVKGTKAGTADLVDFMSGTFKLLQGSWTMKTPPAEWERTKSTYGARQSFAGYGLITESFDVLAKDTGANIIAAEHCLTAMQEYIRKFHTDPKNDMPVYLEVQATGETLTRKSLLYNLEFNYGTAPGFGPLIHLVAGTTYSLPITITVTRHPLWENLEATAITSTYGVTGGAAKKWLYPGGDAHTPAEQGGEGGRNYASTAPNRIAKLTLAGLHTDTTPHINVFSEAWLGIRDYYEGVGFFIPYWKATWAGDLFWSTAISGAYVKTTFLDNTTFLRLSIKVGDIYTKTVEGVPVLASAVDALYFVGHYILLARIMVEANTTVSLQINPGVIGSTDWLPNEIQYVDGAATEGAQVWEYVNLGEFSIPSMSWRTVSESGDSLLMNGFSLYAERLEGSGSLWIDQFVLLPAAHYVHVAGTSASADIISPDVQTQLFTHEDDEQLGVYYHSELVGELYPAAVEFHDWYLPAGGGLLVCALTGQTAATNISLTVSFYKRWLSYGNDTA